MQGQGVVDLDHPKYYNGGKGTLEHVMKQAGEQGMTPGQTQLLLAQTLEHNGLPMIGKPGDPSSGKHHRPFP